MYIYAHVIISMGKVQQRVFVNRVKSAYLGGGRGILYVAAG